MEGIKGQATLWVLVMTVTLAVGGFSLPSPVLAALMLDPATQDAVLAQLNADSRWLDVMLASLDPKPTTVGLGFTQGFLEDFEPEPHDMALDAILNDNGVVTTK